MSRRSGPVLDLVGAGLAAALATLAFVREGTSLAALVAGAAGMLVVGRLLGGVWRPAVPLAVAGVAIWLALTAEVPGSGPLSGPFGYRNATAAFFAQACIAALMLGPAFRGARMRTAGFLVGAAFAAWFASIAFRDSAAGGATVVVAAVALLAFAGARGAHAAIVVSGSLVAAMLVGTVVLGATFQPGRTDVVTRALTERRVVLWHESIDLLIAHPFGVGPGRFADTAPTAIADPDAGWSHNEFLQQGAELGWLGLALTVLLFVWGFVRLWFHPGPDAYVALGAVSLAALGIHASVDYILHFPAVPLVAAAVLGSAQATLRRSRHDRHDPRQEGLESDPHPAGVAGASTSG